MDDVLGIWLRASSEAHGFVGKQFWESKIDDILEKGSPVRLAVKGEKINIFTEDGSSSLIRAHRGD